MNYLILKRSIVPFRYYGYYGVNNLKALHSLSLFHKINSRMIIENPLVAQIIENKNVRYIQSSIDGRRKFLFSCDGRLKIKMMSGLSLFHGFNWVALTVYSNQNPVTLTADASTYVTWISSPFWNNLGLALSASFIYFMHIFSKKYVAEISIVPGSDHLDCYCSTFFGNKSEPRALKFGSVEISPESGSYLPFRPKGDQVFLLMDVRQGLFHDKPALLALLSGKKDPCTEKYLRLPVADMQSHSRRKRSRRKS
mmetsp:Transcript_12739/g.16745  ORF Transcript_12739/g.16745 Transcript_12739/m.16745 type:complete len:253 (-) Transcript_12739:58-816(-)